MIEDSIPFNVQEFISYLNNHISIGKRCLIVFLPDYDCIAIEDGEVGFAVYSMKTQTMYIAGDIIHLFKDDENPEEEVERTIFENITHEYIHHCQHCRGEVFDCNTIISLEEEAEVTAREFVEGYLKCRKALSEDHCRGFRFGNPFDGYEYDCSFEYAGEVLCEDCIFGSHGGLEDPRVNPNEDEEDE